MEVGRTINAPLEKVWELLVDTRSWPLWGPSVASVDVRDRFIRRGSSGRIRTVFGITVRFEISEFEPMRSWRWTVSGISATGHRVERVDDDHCRLLFEVPWWALPYAVVCRQAAENIERILNER